jgi:dethiobiotin synthetase
MPELTTVVSGTATGVGKTWVAGRLIEALRGRGIPVSARKPVESFAPHEDVTDAHVLAHASGEGHTIVCRIEHRYPLAMAPPMAADALGRPRLLLTNLVARLELPAAGVAVIEGVGGPRSPVAHDADTVALADALDARVVVLVSGPGLGALNAVRLAGAAFGPRPVIVMLNRFDRNDDLHRRNREWLANAYGFAVVTNVAALVEELVEKWFVGTSAAVGAREP